MEYSKEDLMALHRWRWSEGVRVTGPTRWTRRGRGQVGALGLAG